MKREVNSDKVFHTVNNTLLFIFLLMVLIPVIYVVAASFSSAEAVISGRVFLWPVEPTLVGYEAVLRDDRIVYGFRNSGLYMVIQVILGVSMTILAAYPLSVQHLPGRKVITFIFTFTMLFGGGMIPTYMLIRDLNMLNTIWSVTIPGLVGVYNIILMRTYFKNNMPETLYEAASIDGCGVFRYLFQFVIPLSGAIIAIIALYVGVASWNSWFEAMLYISNKNLHPLQLVLRDILISSTIDYSTMEAEDIARAQEMIDLMKYSVIVVSTLPMMLIYPFIQRFFVKGVMAGAVKG